MIKGNNSPKQPATSLYPYAIDYFKLKLTTLCCYVNTAKLNLINIFKYSQVHIYLQSLKNYIKKQKRVNISIYKPKIKL